MRSTRYIGGHKIEVYDQGTGVNTPPGADIRAIVTRADGTVRNFSINSGPDGYTTAAGAAVNPATIAGDQEMAKAAYADLEGKEFYVSRHSLAGYGGWLEDTFFLAYSITAKEAERTAGDEVHRASIATTRKPGTAMAMNLSGRGETAMWKGLMVGHDMDENKGPTFGDLLKGNASITANLAPATLSDQSGTTTNMVSLVDVALTNIINGKGEAARVPELIWTNLDLMGAAAGNDNAAGTAPLAVTFSKGSEINGMFYDDGDEVIGNFNKEDIVGVFGAVEYEMMDDGMMADSQ
jgi:hypothetical protein